MAQNEELASVLEAVGSVVPTLRRNGEESERRRWLVEENIQLLDKAGVFRTATPRRYGGLDLPVADQVKVITEIARGCPSTAWTAFVWVSTAWTATLYPDRAQEEFFEGGAVKMSSAVSATGTLAAVEGGYRLDGRWRYNSGCLGADWNLVAAALTHPNGEHEEFMAAVPMSELSTEDDWDVTSCSGTGSVTTIAADVFVPAHRVVGIVEAFTGTAGERTNVGADGRNYGLLAFVLAESAGVFIGAAKGALELFLERLPGRGITYTNWTDQSLHPVTQIQVATAANKISAAEGLSVQWLELLQRRADAGEQPSDTEKAIIRGQVGFAIQLAKEAIELLYSASGGSVIARGVPLQRFHRDVQGFSLHALAQLNANLEVQGRVLVGLDPDTWYL
ncbi:acyl-CoA dehydrogenase family protein [Actinophytocola sp.]|uniref:acyl-CoA dehydrogenase family protein n=1 Tax=Actinophytocola sp. TaxID=1872138 RepID=UPI002ED1A58C